MFLSWALFPLAMQAIYTASSVPPLVRLHRAKHSDQHATLNQWMTLGAHSAMAAWAYLYAGEMGLVASLTIGFATTALNLGTILYYRRFPGGRADGGRRRLRIPLRRNTA